MRKFLLAVCLLCPLTILGCGIGEPVKPVWTAPIVVSDAGQRCPAAGASDRRESRRTTAKPTADVVDPNGKPFVSDDRLKAKIDEFRVAERRKNAALSRVIRESDKCRGTTSPTS